MQSEQELCDMFAAHALAAIIVRDGTPCTPEAQIKLAYWYADRMLDQRLQSPDKESDQ